MNRPMTHPHQVAVALLLAVAAMLPAACGGSTPTGSTPTGSTPTGSATTRQARLDQKLHDLLPQAVKDQGFLRVGTEASYAPMESYAPDGRTIIGMDPDLGVEMGRVLVFASSSSPPTSASCSRTSGAEIWTSPCRP